MELGEYCTQPVCIVDGQKILAFSDVKNGTNDHIHSVVICEGVEKIEENTFSGCTNLKEVYLPDSLKVIEQDAFSECPKLKKIVFPENLEVIGHHAFFNTGLRKVIIPASVKEIGYLAFDGFGHLTSIDVNENNNVYCSVSGVLYSKNKEKLIAVPQFKRSRNFISHPNVKSVEPFAFAECSKLDKVILGNNVEKIGTKAFCGALNIQEVTVPESVKEIADDAFMGYGLAAGGDTNMKGVIKGMANSSAEKAAEEQSIKFVTLS